MKLERRYTDFQFKESDNGLGVVSGTIIRYGDVAIIEGKNKLFTESFQPGWATNLDGVISVNRMHRRDQPLANTESGLTISDTEESMTAEIILPDTTAGRDTAVEIALRLLRGLSLEFIATDEQFDYEREHRSVIKGKMDGFGIVDRPAYADSVVSMKRAAEYSDFYGLGWVVPLDTREKATGGYQVASGGDSEPKAEVKPARRFHFIG